MRQEISKTEYAAMRAQALEQLKSGQHLFGEGGALAPLSSGNISANLDYP